MIHPIIKLKNETMDHQSDKFKEYCEKFVSHIGAQNCENITHNYTTKCTCLLDLAEDTVTAAQAVALLQAHSGMSDEIRNAFLMEWERNALERTNVHARRKRKQVHRHYTSQRKYLRPFALSGVTKDGSSQYTICKNGYGLFFGIGEYRLSTIEKTVKAGGLVPSLHGLRIKREIKV